MTAAPQHPSHLRQLPRPLIWLSLLSFSLGACAPNLGPQPNLGWIEERDPIEWLHGRTGELAPADDNLTPAQETLVRWRLEMEGASP